MIDDPTPPAASSAAASPRVQTFTVPAGMTGAISREYIAWLVRRPSWIALWTTQAVATVVMLAIGIESRSWTPFGATIATACAIAGVVLVASVLTRRSLRLAYPDGFCASASVGEDAVSSTTAIGSGTLSYRGLRAVHPTAHGLILQMRGSGATGVAPRALFSDDDIARIAQHIADAAPASRRAGRGR